MDEAHQKLVNLIQAKILEQNISISQAAAEMKLSRGALGNILNGDRSIGAEAAIRIAHYLGLSPADVLRETGQGDFLTLIQSITNIPPSKLNYLSEQKDLPDPYLQRIAKDMHGLTPSQLKIIINLVNTFKESNPMPTLIGDTSNEQITYPVKRKSKS